MRNELAKLEILPVTDFIQHYRRNWICVKRLCFDRIS